MGSSAGDSTTSKPPQWWTDAAKKALAQGEKVAKIGYVPYMGPDVAAFAPQQIAGIQDAANWAAAFNTPGQAAPDVSASIMPPTDYGNGLKGYGSYDGYKAAIDKLKTTYPGLANYLNSFFINPVTGTSGTNTPPGDPGNPGGGGTGGGTGGTGGHQPGPNTTPTTPRPGPNYTWDPNQGAWVYRPLSQWGRPGQPGGGSMTGGGSGGGVSPNLGFGPGSGGTIGMGGLY